MKNIFKQFKKSGLRALIMILAGAMLLSACTFGGTLALRAPELIDNRESKTIQWYGNEKATAYEVYVNNVVVETIDETGKTVYTYNYSNDVVNDGMYSIKVKSLGGEKYKDSRFSNVVIIYVGNNPSGGYDTSQISLVRESDYAPKNVEYNTTSLDVWWIATQKDGIEASKYVVQIFCNNYTDSTDNSDKIRAFYVTKPFFNVTEYLKGNEILAITISSVYDGDDNLYVSDVFYYNPLNYGEYSNIYVFDGGVYDFYIEDYEELQNLYYYAYINRITKLEFMVSYSFYQNHKTDYFSMQTFAYKTGTAYVHQKYIMGIETSYDLWSYYETFNFVVPYLQIKNSGEGLPTTFILKESFQDVEPNLDKIDGKYYGNSKPTISQYLLEKPYYETTVYPDRPVDYDDFASDKCVLTTTCSTSEQLYWAVENNVTPLFENKTSRAYLIYQSAKNVLREIIKDGMDDYEKALSIFDWIANTGCYDYDAYNNNASTENSCYYLEGMFLDENHAVVCDGLSKAYSLLCNMEGIDCLRIMGTASGGGHAWNKVRLLGKWYVVDLTWTELKQYDTVKDKNENVKYEVVKMGSTYYRTPKLTEKDEYNCHRYFLVNDDYISSSHTPFPNRVKISDSVIPADNMYGYYTSTVFVKNGVGYSRVIDSIEDLSNTLDYLYKNDFGMYEVLIDYDWFNNQNFGSIVNMLQTARGDNTFMGITNMGMINSLSDNWSLINEDGSTTKVTYDGNDYECKYEKVLAQYIVNVGYKYNSLGRLKKGFVLYLSCNTNILQTTSSNINDDTNRYNRFIEYIKSYKSNFNSMITIQDDFLTDVLNLDLSTATEEEIILSIKSYFENDLNKSLEENKFTVSLELDSKGEDSSYVYNETTKTFEESTYNFHKYKIEIIYETI